MKPTAASVMDADEQARRARINSIRRDIAGCFVVPPADAESDLDGLLAEIRQAQPADAPQKRRK